MSNERIDTPENDESITVEVQSGDKAQTKLNANAREFQPRIGVPGPQLRPSAPEFVPRTSPAIPAMGSTIYSEVARLVSKAGVCGILVANIPSVYHATYNKALDLSSCSSSDLSVLLQEIPRLCVLDTALVPESLLHALVSAGFNDATSNDSSLVMGCEEWFPRRFQTDEEGQSESELCDLGADSDKVVVDAQLSQFVNELKTFKESVVDVVAKGCIACPSGIPLSAISTEWEKSFVAKGLVGMPEFASLTRRFHVADLITFLKSIPSLELIQTNHIVIVKLRETLLKSKSVVVLDQELFGMPARSTTEKLVGSADLSVKQHISTSLVSQLISQVDKQVLELGSHLARNGLQTSPQDLVIIRLQLQQLQSLKTALQAVLNPVAPPPSSSVTAGPPSSQAAYAALLSQAAQYAMSAISATKKQAGGVSGASTAVSSKRSSPVAATAAHQLLGLPDVRNLVVRIFERNSMAVSSLATEWQRVYPTLEPLDSLVSKLGFPDLKSFLIKIPHVVVYFASLPSPQLRVATKTQFEVISRDQSVSVVGSASEPSPLLSPTSTCSFTSDNVVQDRALTLISNQKFLEVILKQIRLKQISQIREKSSESGGWRDLYEILEAVKDSKANKLQQSRLESRRPPPIDTDGGNVCSLTPLMKSFIKKASEMVSLPSVSLSRLATLWKADTNSVDATAEVTRLAQSTPGVRLVGSDRCTLTALSSPGAAVASLFACNDTGIWNGSNDRLVSALKRFISPPETTTTQLNELSATLFKSIMSGGSRTAKECAGALKVLAAKDPKAIHEIVTTHIGSLKQCDSKTQMEDAAKAFVNNLMAKGKKVHEAEQPATASLSKLLSDFQSVTLNTFKMPDISQVYLRDALVGVRAEMEEAGLLNEPPSGLALGKLARLLPRDKKQSQVTAAE